MKDMIKRLIRDGQLREDARLSKDPVTQALAKDGGSGGSYARSHDEVKASHAALLTAHQETHQALVEARALLAKGTAGGAFDARRKMQDAASKLQKAGESARLTASVRGADLMKLPQYTAANHPFSQARAAAQEHEALAEKTMQMKSDLLKASRAGEDTAKGLDDFESKHPRGPDGKFT